MRLRRLLAFLAFTLLLDGCTNRVFSNEPWFDKASRVSGPVLRDGIWLTDDPHCKVRESEPAERWPKCAGWEYHRANQSFHLTESCEGKSCRRSFVEWSM